MGLPQTPESPNWERKFKACTHTEAEWEAIRPIFKKLYQHDNLLNVRKIMAKKHGFYANKRQFDRRIKGWKLKKNLTRKKAVAMLKIRDKRAKDGKATGFMYNKQLVGDHKLERAREINIKPQWEPHCPVATPSDVEYWTPKPCDPATPSKHGTPMCADTPPPVADAYSPHATYATLEGVHGDSHHYTQSSSFDSMFPGIDTKVAGFRSPPCDKAPSPTNFETYLPQHFSLYEGRVDQVYSPNAVFNWMDQFQVGDSQGTSLEIDPPFWQPSPKGRLHLRPLRPEEQEKASEPADFTKLDVAIDPLDQWEDRGKRLRLAASRGDEAVVRLLLERGVNISSPDTDGVTPLHHAAFHGQEVVARLLLEKGADISSRSVVGNTPLHDAAQGGHETVVQLLLEEGASASPPNTDGATPLHLAASHGQEVVARLLLEKGADISSRNAFGNTPLHRAAYEGQGAVVQLLLEKGADISPLRTTDGATPLHLAACSGHETVVWLLLEKGAEISPSNTYGNTPLDYAIYMGHEAVVRLLLEKGVDILSQGTNGNTPLHRAAYRGQEAVARLLLEKGADISPLRTTDGATPLHLAACSGHETLVWLLLEKGAEISAQNTRGSTPLHYAAYMGHEAVVWLLLKKGAEISPPDSDGATPLHDAAWKGHETVVRLLLENGARIPSPNSFGNTPLHNAASQGHEAVVRLLLAKGADILVLDQDGYTPLGKAALAGQRVSSPPISYIY